MKKRIVQSLWDFAKPYLAKDTAKRMSVPKMLDEFYDPAHPKFKNFIRDMSPADIQKSKDLRFKIQKAEQNENWDEYTALEKEMNKLWRKTNVHKYIDEDKLERLIIGSKKIREKADLTPKLLSRATNEQLQTLMEHGMIDFDTMMKLMKNRKVTRMNRKMSRELGPEGYDELPLILNPKVKAGEITGDPKLKKFLKSGEREMKRGGRIRRKKGGRVGKPKGVGAAKRGYGKAMKRGK